MGGWYGQNKGNTKWVIIALNQIVITHQYLHVVGVSNIVLHIEEKSTEDSIIQELNRGSNHNGIYTISASVCMVCK